MKQWKFNAGDSIRITNYVGKTENIEYSNIQAMIGNVYVIDNIDEIGGYYRINSELFKENELELVDSTVDQPVVEKILIVNKVRPEYTTYIENTKDVVMKFFVGTRLFDFYVIKNGEMIELNSDKDVFALYEVPKESTFRERLMAAKDGDCIELDGKTFVLSHYSSCFGGWYLNETPNPGMYVKSKTSSNAWFTKEQFATMIEDSTYEIKE